MAFILDDFWGYKLMAQFFIVATFFGDTLCTLLLRRNRPNAFSLYITHETTLVTKTVYKMQNQGFYKENTLFI